MRTVGNEFVSQAELILCRTVGQIVGKSLVQNQLKKLRKDADSLSTQDFGLLSRNILGALSLFVTGQEVEQAKGQLDKLVGTYC